MSGKNDHINYGSNKVAENLFSQKTDKLNMTGGNMNIGKAKWMDPEDAIKLSFYANE